MRIYIIVRTMSHLTSSLARVNRPPEKFHPSKSFNFPKRSFGSQGKDRRSFRAEWCDKYKWLHYEASSDSAFCHVCMVAEFEKKFLASTKRDPAFISSGFTYWKEAISAFKRHMNSMCHREAIEAVEVLPTQVKDIGELLDESTKNEKALNRAMFKRILQNLCFLSRQGLAFRGHGSGENSNFTQLLQLRAYDCPELLTWLGKKTNKYTSAAIQNECLEAMALHILRQICRDVAINGFYTIMADECTDASNKEQFTICLRWVDENLVDHEDVLGLYNVGTIEAESLIKAIIDVVCRAGLSLSQCRGQCYDGASNMSGSKRGVAVQIQAKESRAVLTHCYGHALNLAVGDTIKQSKLCRDSMDTAFEISKLIRFSPKRNAAFERIKVEVPADEDGYTMGIRAFCPTRWTVRGDAIASIIENYGVLQQLWDESLETKLEPDIKGRIIGVKAQMSQYRLVFGLLLCKRILLITDNLSKTLQKQSLSAAEGQEVVKLTLQSLKNMRSADSFDLFFSLVEKVSHQTGCEEPVLPRKRKAPKHLEVGSSEGFHSASIQEYYRQLYFEAIDLVITGITDRFDQPGYNLYKNLEGLLVKSANNTPCDNCLNEVVSFYKDDFKPTELTTQLKLLGTHFSAQNSKSVTFQDCLQYLQSLSEAQKTFYSEVCVLVRLILVMPATNAVSERSFSSMKRLKSYLRSTMNQNRLNHVMILHLNKEKVDNLDLDTIGNEFVEGNEHRLKYFGKFK